MDSARSCGLWHREEAGLVFSEGSDWQAAASGGRTCESCGEEPATIHVLHFDGSAVTHTHLCASCAEEEAGHVDGAALVVALPSMLGTVASAMISAVSSEREHGFAPICAVCGTTLNDFRENGLFGCAACYQVFQSYLDEELEDRTAGEHLGKVPTRTPGGQHQRREVVRLQRMLSELVESERFEEAASVRDRLAELEGQVSAG